ncbi:hypothetical protein BASA81_002941 [Batrachochytrium salamandrivorans]|nr:hypothetical protein BASA81_002941 [Batrachochytrium salamandrivorans]
MPNLASDGEEEDEEEEEEDLEAEQLAYATVQQLPPKTYIETFSLAKMRRTMFWFFLVLIAAVALGVSILVYSHTYSLISTRETRYDLMCECVLRTLASVWLTFGLLVFPQRIFRARYATSTKLSATECVLIFALVLLSVIPGFSVYGVVESWINALNLEQGIENFFQASYSVSLSALLFNTSTEGFALSAVSSSLGIAFQYGFQFALISLEAYPDSIQNTETASTTETASNTETTPPSSIRARKRSIENVAAYDELIKHIVLRRRYCSHVASIVKKHLKMIRVWFVQIRFRYVWILLALYFSCLVAFSIELHFYISYIPFVSLISVIRVCVEDPARWEKGTHPSSADPNVEYISPYLSTFGLCSPQQPIDNSPFWIALGCTIFFVFDIILIINLYISLPKANEHLSSLPYMTSRPYFLGFMYYRFLTWYSFTGLILVGLLVTTVLPVSTYIVSELDYNATNNITAIVIKPLFQVGVTAGNFGFGSCAMIISNWVVTLSYGNLPPDGKGVFVWCCAWKRLPLSKWISKLRLASSGGVSITQPHPLSSATSASFRKMQRGVKSKLRLPHGAFLRQESDIHLMQERGMLPHRYYKPEEDALVRQVRTKVFVLETCVLLYHFMSLAYVMLDPEQQNSSLKSRDENDDEEAATPERALQLEDFQRLVEDDQYTIHLYAKDNESDTHAFCFAGPDRIIVSFRGSVSFKNYQTDYDSTEVLFEPAMRVTPLVDEFTNHLYATNLATKQQPMVHRGFLRTYTTVRREILDCVSGLLEAKPRVVMVTGHSLGGGMATVCSLDLALALRLPPDRIALMTFGSPMAGNLGFSSRFNRIVPCAHRLETANDVITQLPFQTPLTEITLRGWFHIGVQVLLMPNGNGVVEPSPIETFMVHSRSSSIVAHFRLSYASALAAWAIRAHELHAKWWNSVIYEFLHYADLSPLPKPLRECLLRDLRRPGIPYLLHNVLYCDRAFDTSELGTLEDEKSEEDMATKFALLIKSLAQCDNPKQVEEFTKAVLEYAASLPKAGVGKRTADHAELLARYTQGQAEEAATAADAMTRTNPKGRENVDEEEPLV